MEPLLDRIVSELALIGGRTRDLVESGYRRRQMFQQLGWDVEAIAGLSLEPRLAEIAEAASALSALMQSEPTGRTILELGSAAKNLFLSAHKLSSDVEKALRPPRPLLSGQLGTQIFYHILVTHLVFQHRVAFEICRILGLIRNRRKVPVSADDYVEDEKDNNRVLVRGPSSGFELVPSAVTRLLQDPLGHLSTLYLGGKSLDAVELSKVVADTLFPRLVALLHALGADAHYGWDDPGQAADETQRDTLARLATMLTFSFPLAGNTSIGATVAVSGKDLGNLGLIAVPRGQASAGLSTEKWDIDAKIGGNAKVVAFGPQGTAFAGGTDSERFSALVTALRVAQAGTALGLRIGSAQGSRLELSNLRIVAFAELDKKKQDIGLEGSFDEARLTLSLKGGDSFLRSLLSSLELDTDFALCLGLSIANGFYFKGSGGLDSTTPVHRSFGPVTLNEVYLSILANDDVIDVVAACSLTGRLGPITASVSRAGTRVSLSLKEGGNFGILDFEGPKFKPPEGVGFSVDASGLSGGGFLSHNELEHRYAGALQLSFGEIGLTAIGLITTKDPVSILIAICVEFSPSIQLSFGFALRGVGGLIGVNRTLAVDVLRERLRSGAAQSILFPKDLIVNADRIIGDLEAVFPSKKDRFVVGPMVKITWGPDVLQGDLGIFIELPQPVRVVVLGAITLALPRPDKVVIELHLDVLGVVDFGNKTLAIDATLYDSRILGYPLTGDSALRLSWGDNPQFGLSVGGFHPAFTPPANFPVLQRMTLNLSSSSDLQLYAKAYHALTSNSLQFGASLELRAKASGATVEGRLRFDTLIYFSPFSFDVFIGGTIAAKYKGKKLAGISIAVFLSGPRPWHVKGSATFEILWFDITVRIDKKWAEETPVTIEAVDPLVELQNALCRPDTWGGIMPGGRKMQESLRPLEASEKDLIRVHPLGRLEIRQNVLPLGETITKLGNAPVQNYDAIRIAKITIGGQEVQVSAVEDFFARGQFESLTNDQQLSLPSFEPFDAGVVTVGDEIAVDEVGGGLISDTVSCEFEAYELNEDGSLTSRAGSTSSQLPPPTPQPRYRVSETPKAAPQGRFTIASITDLHVATSLPGAELGWRTRMTADGMLREHLRKYPNQIGLLQVIESAA